MDTQRTLFQKFLDKTLYFGITKGKVKKELAEERDVLFRANTKRYSRGNIHLQNAEYTTEKDMKKRKPLKKLSRSH